MNIVEMSIDLITVGEERVESLEVILVPEKLHLESKPIFLKKKLRYLQLHKRKIHLIHILINLEKKNGRH